MSSNSNWAGLHAQPTSSTRYEQTGKPADEWLATHDEDWQCALQVQAALWRRGQIRAVGFPDLLIAAVAERERLTILHYDGDYDLITRVTGQAAQWVVPRGTVP